MRNFLKLSVRNEEGYTLVDGIIQLSVLMLFSQVFAVTVGWTNKIEESITNPIDTEWALFVQNVETYLNDIDTLIIQQEQQGIRFKKGGEEFDIELYQDLIRKQKNRLGHEQMLLHVKSMSIAIEGQTVRFFVKFLNGMEKEHTFYVTIRSE
ncbi:competence type IV pilus minor pilin ComGF [Psychrobacillus sp. OK032]|uniref:competence type IV pilus minor pilin ComGF n=1 Tax=Psychrobacillus sp. OK032 TaxID=1884358 RepID=UPI0008CC2C15|nr:competence type IV pilus minor pilin ComGF [Psychrobacillus sp. OK032]SER80941.1 competence protein ComGF [Psychrobacillus sp. OK032]